ncbi:MAG: ATP-binding protein [Gemmatimonadales bacterium]
MTKAERARRRARPHRSMTHGTGESEAWMGGGEMGALIGAMDWSRTPIGPVESWSPALRMMVRFLLANRFPMMLWWGPDYISMYNDPYRPVLGAKHPWALGKPVQECWSEVWPVLEPLIDTPFHGGPATWNEDIGLELNRHGFLEEAHFTIAYSPVPDDTVPSGIGGVLATVVEITEKVVAERRVVALRDLGARVGEAKTAEQACAAAAETIAAHGKDIPFALLYLISEDGRSARLTGSAGLGDAHGVGPSVVDLTETSEDGWPFAEVVRSQAPRTVHPLGERFAAIPPGPWSDPPDTAVVIPVPSNQAGRAAGLMVVGISARLALDDYYLDFIELARNQIATAIANARAYEEERKRAEALAEIDRAKTAFFSNVSHEFRTPLTLMLGPTEDLLAGTQGVVSSEQRAQLELIRRNELRLQRLVNALLEFSRIEAGRVQASYEPVDIAALTRDLAGSFRSAVERAGLRFNVTCEPVHEPTYVDSRMWEQIVLNLLSNAFKFTFEGQIDVSLSPVEKGVQLRVADTGVGVRAEELPRLFERFHRVEGTRARTHEGSGIGLALVQELVRLHGGSIQAESAYGEGTSFTVTIPTGRAHLPEDRLRAAGSAEGAGLGAVTFVEEALRWLPDDDPNGETGDHVATSPAARSMVLPSANGGRSGASTGPRAHVLVVDDNADMRSYLRRILERHWTVETAADGAAALESARLRRPDLVLTDIMMPVLDGFGLLRRLRADERTASIPIIMLSARAGEEARVDGLEAGAEDYLVKPFSARELVARVRTHLELAGFRDEVRRQEEQLRSLFEQAPIPIGVVRGADFLLELVNPPFARLLGGGEMIGRPLTDFALEPTSSSFDYAVMLRSVASSGVPYAAEGVHMRLDANGDGDPEDHWVDFVCVPIRSTRGEDDRLMMVITDATDKVVSRRRTAEADLERIRADADRHHAMSLRDEFLTVASHELRTPLTTIGLQADGLKSLLERATPGDQTAERCLPKIERLRVQADRLGALIEGMFDVFSIGRDGLQLTPEQVDLAEVARAVVGRARNTSKQAPASIHLRTERSVGIWDRHRLEQIVVHLVSNATKFGSGRPIDVTVDGSRELARLEVKDRGIGIALEDQERIFGRFVRAASATEYAGFGLGLWIVRELVEAMGGDVRVESRVGAGATFVVELPRQP